MNQKKWSRHFTLSFIFIILFCLGPSVFALTNPREKPVAFRNPSGRSGVLFDLGYYYGQSEATANPSPGNEWKDIISVYDIRLGVITESDFYFGGGYMTRSDSLSSQGISSTSGGTAMAGLGYYWGTGFNLRAFYHINETFGNYSSGTGFQADLGYMVNMTSNFYLGALLTHRQTVFTSNSTIANFQTWTRKQTFPMITFGFLIN